MATLTAMDPREEERAARAQQRQLDKLQRAAAEKREREARSKLAGIVREQQARPRWRQCKCGITVRTTRREIRELGEGCTHELGYICPVLDSIRRELGR